PLLSRVENANSQPIIGAEDGCGWFRTLLPCSNNVVRRLRSPGPRIENQRGEVMRPHPGLVRLQSFDSDIVCFDVTLAAAIDISFWTDRASDMRDTPMIKFPEVIQCQIDALRFVGIGRTCTVR